jgi:outer membrane murein-binding lipoprotein Lpp
MSAECTVIIPTHDHAPLLAHTVRSVWAQTMTDFELVVIGDGVGDDTRELMTELCRTDARTRFVDRPKSPRTGEPYRHEVLESCASRWVAYCGDDDLLFPYHLEAARERLRDADLVHGYGSYVDADGEIVVTWVDLARRDHRTCALEIESLAGLTGMAHTMDAYWRLPFGWRTTPTGSFTDHYMYQQFLAEPSVRAGVIPIPTYVHFPSDQRAEWTVAQREAELVDWEARIADRDPVRGVAAAFAAASYAQGTLEVAAHRHLAEHCHQINARSEQLEAERDAERSEREAMASTRTWKLRNRLVRLRERLLTVRVGRRGRRGSRRR